MHMHLQAKGSGFRCQNRSCSQTPRLTAPRFAFTPLFRFASNGTGIDCAMLRRTPFTVGATRGNDAAIQVLRLLGQFLSAAKHKVEDFYTKNKVALAYAETEYGRSVVPGRDRGTGFWSNGCCHDCSAESSSGPNSGLDRKILQRSESPKHCQALCPSPEEVWEPSPGLKWISQSRTQWVLALFELQMVVGL